MKTEKKLSAMEWCGEADSNQTSMPALASYSQHGHDMMDGMHMQIVIFILTFIE